MKTRPTKREREDADLLSYFNRPDNRVLLMIQVADHPALKRLLAAGALERCPHPTVRNGALPASGVRLSVDTRPDNP